MNDATLTELKILVERAVRPVRAPTRRKLRMREELLAHVSDVYEEEAVKPDAASALERTQQRFGDSAELTRSLQESVPTHERVAADLQNLLGRRPGESALRFAFRHAAYAGLYFGGLAGFGFLMSLGLFLAFHAPGTRRQWMELLFVGTMAPTLFLLAAIAVLLLHATWDAMYGASGRSWLRTGLCFLASCTLGPTLMVAAAAQITGDLQHGLNEARTSIPVAALAPPFVCVFLADMIRRTTSGPIGRSWLYTIAVDSGLAVILGTLIFGLALLIGVDVENAFESACIMALVVLQWLLPLDLIISAPRIAGRLRAEQEWSKLPIDPPQGAVA